MFVTTILLIKYKHKRSKTKLWIIIAVVAKNSYQCAFYMRNHEQSLYIVPNKVHCESYETKMVCSCCGTANRTVRETLLIQMAHDKSTVIQILKETMNGAQSSHFFDAIIY